MNIATSLRFAASAAVLTSLAACGGNKAADTTTSATTTATTEVTATAPATAPAAVPATETAAVPAAVPAVADAAPAGGVTLASLTGDAANGEKVFAKCKTCHVAEKGVNRVGPSLWGVVGRHSGSIEGFKYSAANKNSGFVWTPEKLFTYLEAPQKVLPGTYMAFAGLKVPQDRADVIAYLKTKA